VNLPIHVLLSVVNDVVGVVGLQVVVGAESVGVDGRARADTAANLAAQRGSAGLATTFALTVL
jgi:hypothetical protein